MASMPDLIFTVLFFFMTITHMRNETPRLAIETPNGKELTQPSSKRSIVNLYIGTDKQGNTRLQVGNNIVSMEQLRTALSRQRNKTPGMSATADDDMGMEGTDDIIVNIRADRNTPMGVISDVKQELRKGGFLNIRYNATERKEQK